VFPDGVDKVDVITGRGAHQRDVRDNALVIEDAQNVQALRYRTPARQTRTDRLPANPKSIVLNAEPAG
jgi:hypothetical protein